MRNKRWFQTNKKKDISPNKSLFHPSLIIASVTQRPIQLGISSRLPSLNSSPSAASMGSSPYDLHMLFFPYMSQSHILPMVDMAKLFAARGVAVTILTTPSNDALIRPTVTRANSSNPTASTIRLHLISSASTAPAALRRPFDEALRDLRPDCAVTDMFMPWTYDISAARGIPRLVFDGTGFFAPCAENAFERHRPLNALPPEAASFIHPGLPHHFEMLVSQIPEYFKRPGEVRTAFDAIFNKRKEVDPKSYGVLVNSFYELEPDYADYFRNVMCRKAWHIGPVALCNQSLDDKASRGVGGGEGCIDGDRCLKWLNGEKPSSVIYVCFGSGSVFSSAQIGEMALGLESAGHPFVWVVRGSAEKWVPKGFEKKIKGRGMIIRGWAPQLLILSHPAVGGFMTHCGWNSVMEGTSVGLPMVTWPLFAEQFYNERLLVDVVKVGVAVGSKDYMSTSEEMPVVEAAAVEAAVRRVMGEGEEAEERRRRARELGEKARRAVKKGGSSYDDMHNFIHELLDRKAKIKGES